MNFADKGIVAAFTGDGSGSYVDVKGATRAPQAIGVGAGARKAGAVFRVGDTGDCVIVVHQEYSGATGYAIRVRTTRTDKRNPVGIWGPALVATERGDQPGTVLVEHQLAPADGADVRLLTTDQRLSGDSVIEVYAVGGAPVAADKLFISVEAR
jgi:hypothetical protein